MKLPKGWKICEFGQLLIEKPDYGANASAIPYNEGKTLRYLRITDIDDAGRLLSEPKVGIHPNLAKGSEVEEGEILIARTGATVGKSYLVEKLPYPAAFAGYLIRFRINYQLSLKEYIRQFLRSPRYWKWVGTTIHAGAQPNINSQEFTSLKIPLPPLHVQRKIADILFTWDEALETIDALIAAKTLQKQALMQQLLTGKTRVKGAKGKWKNSTLSDMLVSITRTVTKPEGMFLAAGIRSHGKGVFLKPDFKPEDIALDELFEIKTGDLIINITFAWEGAAAIVSDQADGALVSHRFPTFLFKDGVASCSFFRHYIRSKRFVFDCGLASPGGAGRNRVLSKSAFLDIELKTPPFEEQQQIGNILDTADQELTLLRTQRQTLDQQKRGLMQLLLTGKVRVTP